MFDFATYYNPKPEAAQPFRLPFHCGPIQARLLKERAKRPKVRNHLIFQPSNPNVANA